jgi:HAD superfamily hydrolase (TIGR01509 family)
MRETSAIDLLICDCDGVLIDSEVISIRLMREALGALFPVAELELVLHGTFGLQSRDILAKVEAHFDMRLPADFHPELLKRGEMIIRAEAKPIPGVREALHAIDLPLAVASNGRTENVLHALDLAGLRDRVDIGVFSAEQVALPKPAPDLYLLAARTAGIPPERCLVVEDSPTGVTAALAAGMRVIGFLGASHIPPEHADTLRQLGVEAFLHDMRELPALVDELRQTRPAIQPS